MSLRYTVLDVFIDFFRILRYFSTLETAVPFEHCNHFYIVRIIVLYNTSFVTSQRDSRNLLK